MKKEELLDLIDETRSALISQATDGSVSENEYQRLRKELLDIPDIKDKVPRFLKSNHTAKAFRQDMQGQADHYAGRRKIINDQIAELTEYIEDHYENDDDPFRNVTHYIRCEELGRGGFGSVYKYHNDCLDMDFAVKIFDPVFVDENEQKEGEKRFFREAKMMFELNNEHVVRIYDAGRLDDGAPFIRMELVRGMNLYKFHTEKGIQPFNTVTKIAVQILDGLQCAHAHDIIHRDLKPSNIMISTENPKRWICKIIDFGIGAFMNTTGHTRLTRTGEQIAGGSYIDPILQERPNLRDVRTDIYSVGAIIYYLLTGSSPKGSDMIAQLKQICPDLTDKQVNIVKNCLSSTLDERFSSCEELKTALTNATK